MCLAVPGRVEEIIEKDGVLMGRVNFDGILKEVCLAYVPDIRVGEYTIVHVGFALTKIDEESAQKTLNTFREMGLLEEELADGDEPELIPNAAQPESHQVEK